MAAIRNYHTIGWLKAIEMYTLTVIGDQELKIKVYTGPCFL